MINYKTKNTNLGIFGEPLNRKCWHILRPFGLIHGRLVYYIAIWYNLRSFGIFFPFWYVWSKKNLATLM
jgi:hypothetical protein